jgi:branched-subunit amino acid transport protein
MTWLVVLSVSAVCVLLRVAGPVLLKDRPLPVELERRLNRAIPPLLIALVSLQLFDGNGHVSMDARAPGVFVGGVLFLWRRSMMVALLAATVVTACLRTIGG